MIKSFKHKGLEKFFKTGSQAGITPEHALALGQILGALNVAKNEQDMNFPGWKLHSLKGDQLGTWSVWVSPNYRLTWRFSSSDAEGVDYVDYH